MSLSMEKRKMFQSGTYLASIPADVVCDNFLPMSSISPAVVNGFVFVLRA